MLSQLIVGAPLRWHRERNDSYSAVRQHGRRSRRKGDGSVGKLVEILEYVVVNQSCGSTSLFGYLPKRF